MECGAIMTALTREASRPFDLAQAHSLDDILADAAAENVRRGIRVPVADGFPEGT